MKFVVGKHDEIGPGDRKIVRVAGRSIGVFNVEGHFYAIRNRCPHQGAPLCEGKLWGSLKADVPGQFEYSGTKDIITCIWHGWEFSLKTGQSWCDPQRLRVRSYEVIVEQPEGIKPEMPVAPDDAVKNPMITAVTSPNRPSAAEDNATDGDAAQGGGAPAEGMVKGPYTVETYPVTVEDGYLYLVLDVVDVATPTATRPA